MGRALDDELETNDVNNPDTIVNILKLFNYPGFLGKNIFQPIGAPHTWIHCLSILDFMAEMARYSSAFKNHCEEVYAKENELENDENYFLRKAVIEKRPEIITDRLNEEI